MPRALAAVGSLQALVTDAWWPPAGGLRWGARARSRLEARFHPDLAMADVRSGGIPWLLAEAWRRASSSGWDLLLARNRRFDGLASRATARILAEARVPRGEATVFAYSYAATDTIARVSAGGHRTVLGQIDGGEWEEHIVMQEIARYPELRDRYRPAPAAYWKQWRAQCAAADRIVVNSPWARACLEHGGIPAGKLATVPLFCADDEAGTVEPREYPERFSAERPLRVLFLGQLNLRKGAARLFDAIRRLRGEPVEFRFVGPMLVDVPEDVRALPAVRLVGPVERARVRGHYLDADVYILPTLSDGYALTQLEAQRYRLPVIASRYCGPVVRDGVNGVLLAEPEPAAIVDALRALVRDPATLASMSRNATTTFESLPAYGRCLVEAACS